VTDQPDDAPTRKGETEGVRIIGAEEAAEAIGRSDVAQRRPDDVPRYGDRPTPPPEDGPRPAIRFPLTSGDPSAVEHPPLAPSDPPVRPSGGPPSGDTALPHWTDPPTGEVPRIFAPDEDADDLDAWSTFSSSGPRWRDSSTDYDLHDYEDVSRLGDDETRIGALDERDRPDPHDFFADEPALGEDPSGGYPSASTRTITSDPRRSAASNQRVDRSGAGRDVPMAVGVGVVFGIVAIICFMVGPALTMVLVAAVIGLAGLEFFNAVRKAGYQPATLLGAAAVVAFALAAYYKGDVAYPLVIFLTVVFGMLWFWWITTDRVVVNLGLTLLGVAYVGGLGSFAALLLRGHGVGLLLAALIPTVAYDVGGFVVGRNAGRAPLTDISPNKTVEGLLGGMLLALIAGYITASFVQAFDGTGTLEKLWLGAVVAIAAPLGDLCESLVKRDLGVKDMGDILPGHGGMLDRFDALLFVLPSVYYLSLIILK
jgi:phosphatidate cytidylyltransferase